jgi:hypothetical protein
MRLYPGMGILHLERNLMRKFLAITVMLLIVSPAANARANDATNLYQALLSKQLEQMPEGFSSATLGVMPLNSESQRAGMVGIAKITLTGKDTGGQVRYAVFSSKQDFDAFVREFSMPGNPIFFPYAPEAKCTSHGNQQACNITEGTVMVMAIITDQTEGIRRTTAGKLAKFALEHLRRVRQSIGQPAPPPED